MGPPFTSLAARIRGESLLLGTVLRAFPAGPKSNQFDPLPCVRYAPGESGVALRHRRGTRCWMAVAEGNPLATPTTGGEPVKRDVGPVSTEETAAAQQVNHNHPARPEQYDESFARGQTELPHEPALQPGPNYARGVAAEAGPHARQAPGHFSRGQEVLPVDDPEKVVEGRFSVGSEQPPS